MWSRRIGYVLFLGFNIFGLCFYHHYVMMIWVVALFVLPLISYILTKYTFRKLFFSISMNRISVGKKVPVTLKIVTKNPTILPIENLHLLLKVQNGFYENAEDYELIVPVFSFSKREVSMEVAGEYCGRVTAFIYKMQLQDLLGLFAFSKELELSKEFLVMPESNLELPQINLSTTGVANDDEVQYVKGDDVSQISLIRDYIPGDRLQNIHWKLSSKKEELQVKEYSKPFSDEILLLVELLKYSEKPEVTDMVIEAFFAAGSYLLKQGRRFRGAWYNSKTMELFETKIETGEELLNALHELYYMDLYEGNPMSYEFYQALHGERQLTTMYIAGPETTGISGEKIDLHNDKVVMLCLSVHS